MKNKLLRKGFVRILVVALAAAALFSGCAPDNENELVFATNAEFPPFEYYQQNGAIDNYDGIDMQMAKEIAEALDKTPVISDMAFESVISAVVGGKADVAIAGLSIDPDRINDVDFTEPYWVAVQSILVPVTDTSITSVESLKGKTVGVVTSFTGDLKLSEIPEINLQRYQKGMDAVMDLKNGRLAAVVIDSPTANIFVSKNPDLKAVTDDAVFEAEQYALAVKKGNTELLNQLNEVINDMKAAGRIDEIASEVDARYAAE